MADLHGVPVTIEGAECPDDDGGCKLVVRKCCGTGCHWDDVRQCENCGAFEVDADTFALVTVDAERRAHPAGEGGPR